ncbi:MAG: copper amine oxidase N-terminal domain-containing protein [Clostridiales bacterium]|nr:copper amine oxidase N-terminal domain-containing protein [Clostridiales bacterium]
MKKFLSLLFAIALLLSFNITALADDTINVTLDGNHVEFDVKPQIIDGRTMVPIRAIFEKMGAVVEWNEDTSTAICTKGDTVVKMTVDSTDMYVNDQLTKMDISPVVIDGRTLAPARYAAEAFGADVQWSQNNNTVVICSKDVYAYADYPDIPDLGKCYNIPLLSEDNQDGYKIFTYLYSDMENDDYYSYLYDNSALILGEYKEEAIDTTNGTVMIAYTKKGNTVPRYYIYGSYDENHNMIFVVKIPIKKAAETTENKVTLYSLDGRTIEVLESEVEAYLNVGWYRTLAETIKVTLYSLDGRTIEVLESEVEAYLNVGWYRTLAETQQTMYAPDGRTIAVFKSEVPAYKNVGWYETQSEAQAANQPAKNSSTSNNPSADGYYYRTPTGKKYHLDPNCGGKNSYRTTNIAGLSPCSKCAK